MNNKFQDLRDLANSTKATVMAIQETWGKNPTTDYSIKGFHRPEFKLRTGEGMNLGGGVGIWIRDNQDYDNIKMISIDRVCEMQAVSLHDLNISIINVYRPFGDMCVFISTLESNILAAKQKYPSNDIILVGDFNVNLLKSSCNTDSLLETTLGLGLIQQVSLPTRVSDNFETLIDHVYTCSRRKLKTDVITSQISDHYATLTSFLNDKQDRKKIKITKRWFKEESYIELATMLAATDWSPMETMNCEDSAEYLESKIKEAMDIIAPIETKIVKNKKENQWLTAGIRISLVTSRLLYKRYRTSKSVIDKLAYKKYNCVLKKVNRAARDKYYGYRLKGADNDTRKVWSILNEVVDRKQCKHRIPNRFIINNCSVRNRKNISNAFNNYFASIGQDMADSLPEVP